MKFNIATKTLYTDEGVLIKKMHCPERMHWSQMINDENPTARLCERCERKVNDTAHFTDNELLEMVKRDPHSCFKVDLDQDNLTLESY